MKDERESSPLRDPRLHRPRPAHEIAREKGERAKRACIEQRKLVLLVDLDQTVVHSTNRPPTFDPAKHPDITHFQLYGSNHWTKLRPHTRSFFENLAPMFEKHIITFGERQYAHKIAEIIDPTKKIFLDRILSRDESVSQQHKTENLAVLFPAGAELVVIIDDREDVWRSCDRLVQLRPYKYFREVDDINAPPGASERPSDAPPTEGETTQVDNLPEETDETLVHVERVLRKVHEAFYSHYDDTGNIRDLKVIISCLREQTLKGCVLVLSGLIPLGADPKGSDVYRIARKFGARVEERVDEQTTHVVAARWGTTKVFDARRLGVPIVTPHWIYACMELWEKAPVHPYILTHNENCEKSASPIEGAGNASGLADLPTMDKELISDMADEADIIEIPLSHPMELPELKCTLCLELLNEASLSPCCGESFCAECISYTFMMGTVCPNCKKDGVCIDQIVSNKSVRSIVDSQHSTPIGTALVSKYGAPEAQVVPVPVAAFQPNIPPFPSGDTVMVIDSMTQQPINNPMFGTADKSIIPVGETYQASRIRLKEAWEEYKNRDRGGKKDVKAKSPKIQPMKAWEEYKNNNGGEKKEEREKSPKIQPMKEWEEYKNNNGGEMKEDREKSPKIKPKKPPSLVRGAKSGGEYDRGGIRNKKKKAKKAKKTLDLTVPCGADTAMGSESGMPIPVLSIESGTIPRSEIPYHEPMQLGTAPPGVYAAPTAGPSTSLEGGEIVPPDNTVYVDAYGQVIPKSAMIPMQQSGESLGVYTTPVGRPSTSLLEGGAIVPPDNIIYVDVYGQVIPRSAIIPYPHSSNYGRSGYWGRGSGVNYERMEADRRYRAEEERRRRHGDDRRDDRRERGERDDRDDRRYR